MRRTMPMARTTVLLVATLASALVGCGGIVDGATRDAGAFDAGGGTSALPGSSVSAPASDAAATGADAGSTGSASSSRGPDSGSTTPPGAGNCNAPTHVTIGGGTTGTTCSGTFVGARSPCQTAGHSDVFLEVDGPPGPITIHASHGISVLLWPDCDIAETTDCQFGSPQLPDTTFSPIYAGRLLVLERQDIPCGDFTVSVTSP